MSGQRILLFGFKSSRELRTYEVDIDEDDDIEADQFDFSDNGKYTSLL